MSMITAEALNDTAWVSEMVEQIDRQVDEALKGDVSKREEIRARGYTYIANMLELAAGTMRALADAELTVAGIKARETDAPSNVIPFPARRPAA
jgi:hypothetical protein